MASPLFITLQIASLRYRFDVPESILFTNTYESIEAEMQTQTIDYDLPDTATTLDLQDDQFSIEYPRDIELELVNETLLIDEGC